MEPHLDSPPAGATELRTVRILTYNVRNCLGVDGMLSPSRIASVIAETQADIVALQELDARRARSAGIDQAHAIAGELGMHHVYFHPALRVIEEEYGDAILTATRSRLVKAGPLPEFSRKREPRGALWAAVDLGGLELQVINTHFGRGRAERRAQADAILGPEWLGHPDCRAPVVLLGDFNSFPRGRVYRRFAGVLRDAQAAVEGHRPQATFPSPLPLFRIDHVFVSADITVKSVTTLRAPLARLASDHLPLLADLRIESLSPTPASGNGSAGEGT